MVAFIDAHREVYGVESICARVADRPVDILSAQGRSSADPTRRSARAHRDDGAAREHSSDLDENISVYGPRKVWRQMGREGLARRALPRAPLDARDGPGRRGARPGMGDHDAVAAGRAERPMRSRRARFHGDAAESALGGGLHVCRDLAGLRLRRLRHRRLRAAHRRLARFGLAARPTSCSMRSSKRSTIAAAHDVGDLVHHSDRGTQLGFKGSSQRVCVSSSLSDFEVPLQAFSSRVFFAADC